MEATAYYRPVSGIGRLLMSLRSRPIRMGAVGLGAGTLAAAGKPGDVIRFYEIDPDVERVAREHFSFISGSPANVEVVLGDARLSMERESSQNYDVLALDAFSGDGIPFHLMTREVMETYLRHVKPDGVLAFHISNRHLDLAPIVGGLAHHYGLHTVFIRDNDATWALTAREQRSLEGVRRFASPDVVPTTTRLWTDDFASLLPILRWRKAP
jgi:spermidine synthase